MIKRLLTNKQTKTSLKQNWRPLFTSSCILLRTSQFAQNPCLVQCQKLFSPIRLQCVDQLPGDKKRTTTLTGLIVRPQSAASRSNSIGANVGCELSLIFLKVMLQHFCLKYWFRGTARGQQLCYGNTPVLKTTPRVAALNVELKVVRAQCCVKNCY